MIDLLPDLQLNYSQKKGRINMDYSGFMGKQLYYFFPYLKE
jgi:hypothetical protein